METKKRPYQSAVSMDKPDIEVLKKAAHAHCVPMKDLLRSFTDFLKSGGEINFPVNEYPRIRSGGRPRKVAANA